jgi:hypothetical protein
MMNLKNRNERKTHELEYNYQLKTRSNKLVFQGNNKKSNKVSIDNK